MCWDGSAWCQQRFKLDASQVNTVHASTDSCAYFSVNKYISESTRPDNRVYTWGYAELGALGNRNLLKPKNGKKPYTYLHRPMRLWFAELNKASGVCVCVYDIMK